MTAMMWPRKNDQWAEALRVAQSARYWARRYMVASVRVEEAASDVLRAIDESQEDDDA